MLLTALVLKPLLKKVVVDEFEVLQQLAYRSVQQRGQGTEEYDAARRP